MQMEIKEPHFWTFFFLIYYYFEEEHINCLKLTLILPALIFVTVIYINFLIHTLYLDRRKMKDAVFVSNFIKSVKRNFMNETAVIEVFGRLFKLVAW